MPKAPKTSTRRRAPAARADPAALARRLFGFESLRPGQEKAVRAVLAGRDVLAVLPTGAGKSAIYQIAGAALPGPTVVVSPLIALQRDQAQKLDNGASGGAAIVNSGVRELERREAFDDLLGDTLEFIFLAPEQLGRADVLEKLVAARPSLFVVDEAHCISEWGHDFRPDYLRLEPVIAALGQPRVLALTATAPPDVRREIVERLGLRSPAFVLGDLDRPNIRLGVRACRTPAKKLAALLEELERVDPPGIIYTATRRHAEEVTAAIADTGVECEVYHGGAAKPKRDAAQERFMAGDAAVIVATPAFGMGVDKPDVRFVYHFDVPGSIASYYQEMGRAGRDGAPARALLLYRPQDLALHKFFAGGGRLKPAELEAVADAVRVHGAADLAVLRDVTELSARKVSKAIVELERQGLLELAGRARDGRSDGAADTAEAVEAMQGRERDHRARLARDLERMRAYAELVDCRRRYLLESLGQESAPCGRCDNCERGLPAVRDAAARERPFPPNTRVRHRKLGKGVVLGYAGERVTILFDDAGEKTVDVRFALSRKLLESA